MGMAQADEVQLKIIDKAGRVQGKLAICLLPKARAQDVVPLINDSDNPDRDLFIEPIQLLEGHEYLYEIKLCEPASEVTTDQESIFFPDTKEGVRGRLRTGLYTGTVHVTFMANSRELGTAAFEVRSRKVDYLSQYRWMLRDIADSMAELIMQSFAPSEQRFIIDDTRDAATLYQRFAFLRSLVMDESLDDAITHIANRPHREWIEACEWRHPGQPIPASSAVARQIARPGPRICSGVGAGLVSYPLPTKLEVVRTRETLDTEPNRFVRFALQQWRQVVYEIGEALKRSQGSVTRASRELQGVLERIDHYLRVTNFPELSPLTRFPAGNMVLQRAEGYRTILQLYLQFEMAAQLSWTGGDDVYKAGQRDIATLYEYWVYLQLACIIARIVGTKLDYSALLQRSGDGLSINLKKGCQCVVKGTVERLGRKLRIEFWFNRVFSRKAHDGSWTRAMQPDFSLKISPIEEGATYTETWVHFDAKYRVETITQLFGRPGGAQPNTDESREELNDNRQTQAEEVFGDAEETTTGRPLRADLLKMHAYRDAIRRSSGAYVVYPGTQQELATEYHEILPGLGAFDLRPTRDGVADGTKALIQFIEDVMEHVASQVTQHERERFWVYQAYSGELPVRPARSAPFLTKPPADTVVLLGYVKNEAHLAWIQKTGRYNLRADGRTGSVGLHGEELAAELVILYGPPLHAMEVWRVVDGPQVMTYQRMLELDYPTPRGELYICLPVERVEAREWEKRLSGSHIDRLRIEKAPGVPTGAPIVTTWWKVAESANAPARSP